MQLISAPAPVLFFSALALAFSLASTFHAALRIGPRSRVCVLMVLIPVIAATPLLVPGDDPFARLVLAILAMLFALKIVDLHIGACKGQRVGFAAFLAFMGNPLHLVQRRTGFEPQPSRRENGRNYLLSLGGMLLAFGLLKWTGAIDWSERSFLLQHTARATAFFLYILFMFQNVAAVLRVFAVYTIDPVRQPLAARTPAQFWRRYNRWMGQFLREDVFNLMDGRRRPRQATMAVFVVSGLLHEYLFAMATGRVQGFQMLFFLIQGVATALTLRTRPVGMAAIFWIGATLVFNLLSSILFFTSMQGVGRFYPTGLPGWLYLG